MLIVPARHGWRWMTRALRLLGKAPFAWVLVSIAYWVVMGVVARLPYVGLAAGSLVMPAIAVSFLAMCRELDQGRPLEPKLVAAGFRRNLPALVTLGGLYLAATLAIFAATWPIDGGTLARWMLFGTVAPVDGGEDAFFWALVAAFALWVPVQLAFWFAPPLVAWEAMSATKALFFSFFAAVRNWAAFLVFAAVAGGAAAAATALLFNLQRMRAGPGVVPTVVFLVLVAAIPLYYATLYASYRDVFPAEPPPEPTPPAPR
ncbi:MAG: BPSS1780 family membrane protein [Burkholderiales bacterium]